MKINHYGLITYFAVIFILVSGSISAQNLTYYVDSNDGDDSGSGLATGYAWKTFTNVNSKTFKAGDQILLKSGSVFTGQFKPKGSGTVGNPIIVDMYGGAIKPIINGGGVTGQGTIYLVNQAYIEISNLEITNSAAASGDRRGVNIANSNGGVLRHIFLRNLDIHNVTGIVGDDDKSKRTAGIGVETIADDNVKESRYDSVLIEGCHIYNVQNTGLYTDNTVKRNDYPRTTAWTNRRFTNLMIRNNEINNISKNAMIIRLAEKGVVEHNVCYETALQTTGNTMFTQSCDSTTFQYNEGYYNRSTGSDGSMYDADLSSPNTIWQYSYSHDNAHGLMWFWTDTADANIIVRYNISQNDKGNLIAFHNDFKSAYVYNNVFYIGKDVGPDIINEYSGQSETYTFQNNIIYNLSDSAKYTFKSAKRTINYNVFYEAGGSIPSGRPSDNNALYKDPQFVNPGSGTFGLSSLDGYKLQATSPCINSGTTEYKHCSLDFWGDPIPYGSGIDRGAYEFAPTAVLDMNSAKSEYVLNQNYPNPFNPSTTIRYHLAEQAKIRIELISSTGEIIATVLNNTQSAGDKELHLNMAQYHLSSGMYLYRMSGNELASGKTFSIAKKMIYLK